MLGGVAEVWRAAAWDMELLLFSFGRFLGALCLFHQAGFKPVRCRPREGGDPRLPVMVVGPRLRGDDSWQSTTPPREPA